MDNPAPFNHFIVTVLGVGIPRNQNAIRDFVSTFGGLLGTSEDELDSFITGIHSSNSGRTAAQKITIPPHVHIGLKSILFELKDCQICGSLSNLVVLNAIDNAQLVTL